MRKEPTEGFILPLDEAKKAILAVGEGRGFVVDGPDEERLVVTSAHCLPYLPPAHAASLLQERTYGALLGPLGEKPTVWAECLFANPVADLAVLGPPDDQALPDEHDAFEQLVDDSLALPVGDLPEGGPAWLLSLEGEWFRRSVECLGGPFWVRDAADRIRGGMSGSPILADDGSAIGVVSTGGPDPHLLYDLPAWLALDSVRRQRAKIQQKRIAAVVRKTRGPKT